MSIIMARVFTLRRNDFWWGAFRYESPNSSWFHIHHGCSNHDWCKSRVGVKELGTYVDGLFVILCCRIHKCICFCASFNSFLLEINIKSKIDAICYLSFNFSSNFGSYRLSINRKWPVHIIMCTGHFYFNAFYSTHRELIPYCIPSTSHTYRFHHRGYRFHPNRLVCRQLEHRFLSRQFPLDVYRH